MVDLAGALLAPAFVDSHVHTVRTGFALTGLDLTGSPSLAGTLDELAAFDRKHPEQGVLVGQGWDETHWPEHRPPTGDELERAAPARRTYLTRVDGHSSVVSPALAALVPGLADLDGWTADGRVERDAHHAVRAVLEGLIGPDDRLQATRAACRAMAAQGITAFHENAAPHIGPEHEIELIRSAADEVGLRATIYWGELMAVETAQRLGAAGLAGDLIADGAFGSRTAALTEPYADRPGTCGHAYISADQVRDHVVACTRGGLQAGFHCIGDAALEAIREGFEAAEREVGAAAIRKRPAPSRARRDALARHARHHEPARHHRQRAADVRRPVGRPRRHVRRAAGRALAAHQPVPRARRRRRHAGLRLRLTGHAAGALGSGPRGRAAPRRGAPSRPGHGVRRAHWWCAAGGRVRPPTSPSGTTSRT